MSNAGDDRNWIELVEPTSQRPMFVNLSRGICQWRPPSDSQVRRMNQNCWWELFDRKLNRFYYYNALKQCTQWERPDNADIIPLAKIQWKSRRETPRTQSANPSAATPSSQPRSKHSQLIGRTINGLLPRSKSSSRSRSIGGSLHSPNNYSLCKLDLLTGANANVGFQRYASQYSVCSSVSGASAWQQPTLHQPPPPPHLMGTLPGRAPSTGRPPLYDTNALKSAFDEQCTVSEVSVDSGVPPDASSYSWDDSGVAPVEDAYHQQQSSMLGNNPLYGYSPYAALPTPGALRYAGQGGYPVYVPSNLYWVYDMQANKTGSTTMLQQNPLPGKRSGFPRTNPAAKPRANEASPTKKYSVGSRSMLENDQATFSSIYATNRRSRKGPVLKSSRSLASPDLISAESPTRSAEPVSHSEVKPDISQSDCSPNHKAKPPRSSSAHPSPSTGNKDRTAVIDREEESVAVTAVAEPSPETNGDESNTGLKRLASTCSVSSCGSESTASTFMQHTGGRKENIFADDESSAYLPHFSAYPNAGLPYTIPYADHSPGHLLPGATISPYLIMQKPNSLAMSQDHNNDVNSAYYSPPIYASPVQSPQQYFQHLAATHAQISSPQVGPLPGWNLSLFRKDLLPTKLLSWTKDSISKPLLQATPKALKKDALESFKQIQMYMGDRKSKMTSDNLLLVLIQKGWNLPALRDELYMQVCKQTTNNLNLNSTCLGWELLCSFLAFLSPSNHFQPYLEGYILRHLSAPKPGEEALSPQVLRLCHVASQQIRKAGQHAATRNIAGQPFTLMEVQQAKQSVLSPSMFGGSLLDCMLLQRDVWPDRKLPWILVVLTEEILRLNGPRTEGIFRIPGDPESVHAMRCLCEQWEAPTGFTTNPHVPATLFKHWIRELSQPIIPAQLSQTCLQSGESPEEATSILAQLPRLNQLVLMYFVRFLQVFAAEENVYESKMDATNLSFALGPLLFQWEWPGNGLMESAFAQSAFLKTLILHLDTSDVEDMQ